MTNMAGNSKCREKECRGRWMQLQTGDQGGLPEEVMWSRDLKEKERE